MEVKIVAMETDCGGENIDLYQRILNLGNEGYKHIYENDTILIFSKIELTDEEVETIVNSDDEYVSTEDKTFIIQEVMF